MTKIGTPGWDPTDHIPHDDDGVDDRQPLLARRSDSDAKSGVESIPMAERRTTTSTAYRERTETTAETSFIEEDINTRAWEALTTEFPRARATELQARFSETGRLQVKVFGFGNKSYFLFTEDRLKGDETLNPQLTKEIKATLGPTRKSLIGQNNQEIRDLEERISEDDEIANDRTISETVGQSARERVLENNGWREKLE